MTDLNDDIDWRLLERHLAGETSPAETARFQAWLDADASRALLVARFQRIWAHSRSQPGRYDAEDAWNEIADKLDPPAEASVRAFPRQSVSSAKPRRWRQTVVRIAAVLVLAVAGGVLAQVLPRWRGGQPDVIAMREIVTARGQRATVRLSDGSRVVLGPESRLEAPERFERDTRTLALEGEAYFEVARDERRPFVVRSGASLTRVLGTSFAVRAYRAEDDVRVVVRTGRVRLESAAAEGETGAVLTPGQAGRLAAGGGVAIESDVDLDLYLDWTHGRLVFEDAPLRSVAADLERWYDVEISLADLTIADFPLTAAFGRQPLDEVLTVIARSLNVQYARDGGRIEFFAAGPARQ